MRRSKALGTALAIAVGLTMVVLNQGRADADEFIRSPGDQNTGPKPPDYTLSYCWGSNFSSAAFKTAATDAMQSMDAQTSYSVAPQACLGANLIWTLEDISDAGGTTYGESFCNLSSGNGECVQSIIKLDPTDLTSYTMRRHTACHELGHTLGVTHKPPQSDCMQSGVFAPQVLDLHHVGHLQASHDSPFGNFEGAARGSGYIFYVGWALDPDAAATPTAQVRVLVDVTWFAPITAGDLRNDVGAVYPYWGPYHGFFGAVPVGTGPNNVCVYAVNAIGGGASALLGCTVVP